MIVDDEEPVLDSFAFILNKYIDDFELCAKARSGLEAEKLIKELGPDLVFMDIQMPGIDGIEAISRVKDLFPDTIFILATAYERFDIARRAIKLGIFSYLVKPISKTKIIDELAKVKAFLDQKKEEQSEHEDREQLLEKTKGAKKNVFLSELMWKNPDKESWDEFSQLFSFGSERAAVFLVGGGTAIPEDLRAQYFLRITSKLEFKYLCVSSVIGDKLLLLIPEQQPPEKLTSYLRRIISDQSPELKLGCGGVYHFSQLKQSCIEAWRPFSDQILKDDNAESRSGSVEYVYSAIMTSGQKDAENLFREFWIRRFSEDSFSVAKCKMAVLFTLLLRKIDLHQKLSSNFNIEPSEKIMPLSTMSEWEEWAERAIRTVCGMLESEKNSNFPKPLTAALDYIAENYDKPLQLTRVAEECMVSGSYLSRLFSEHLDSKFIDYLNRYRINKALINMKKMSIKRASYLAGYRDPNYFSRVFRKFMGMTPSEYEKGILQND